MDTQITYGLSQIPVYLNGRRVGEIIETIGGFKYCLADDLLGGGYFPTLELCKISIESD